MNYNTMKATIKGATCEGIPFFEELLFTLIPPANGNHYGTGYYMTVKTAAQTFLVDVGYERTVDVEILADRWIENHYGRNARDVIKQF